MFDIRSIYSDQFNNCVGAFRHKNFFFNPFKVAKLLQNYDGIKFPIFTIAIQRPGEFVITGKGAFHGGFNCGGNRNEAINFGFENWGHYFISSNETYDCTCVPSVSFSKEEIATILSL